MPRVRWPIRDSCTALAADTIDIDYVAQENLYLEQILITWSTAPLTSENLTIAIDAVGGAAYDRDMFVVDPSVDSLTVWQAVSLPLAVVLVGDIVKVDYANTDDNGVGVELIFAPVSD